MNQEMRELTVAMPLQISKAIEIAHKSTLTPFNNIHNVLISGLGGSGIGATIVANWVSDSCPVPITVNKGYSLPKFVTENTLVICCSYSGNTEETLKVLETAHTKNSKIVCITSGGKMLDFCIKNKLDAIQVPGGMPPRACLGYSLVQLVHTITYFRLIDSEYFNHFKNIPSFLEKEQAQLDIYTKELSEKLFDKMPVLYSDEKMEGVLIRYRQQINENGKMLCWHHVIPEMNHNEMVGWRDKNNHLAVLFINSDMDFERNVQRRKINEETINNYTQNIYNIASKGANIVEQSMYHIHLCDILSIHLAEKRQVESMEIDVINALKGTLENLPW